MKMIFRNKHNGRFLTPIEVLPKYVRMYHEASDRVFWYKKATLHEHLQVVHHDVRVGDVLRDARDGSLLEVLRVSTDGVMLRSGKTQRGVLLTGLVNYARVGRNYKLKRPGVVAKEITRTEHPYTKYDERKVREHIDNARAQAAAMIQAGDDAKRFGIGVLLVYPDGSMKSTDPRGVVLR
ncbi:TPA: hypothetical protein ORQ59_002257 [Escherichia coli]|nr:hypothetical protein [Escherichia coli]